MAVSCATSSRSTRRWRCAQHAETVLRFIPFSAARDESAVSFPRRKSNCGAQFTRITAAAGGTGCAGVNTRNSQATGTAAATIGVTWIEVCVTEPTADYPAELTQTH